MFELCDMLLLKDETRPRLCLLDGSGPGGGPGGGGGVGSDFFLVGVFAV